MAKSAYTKFVLRTTKKTGVAPLYTRRVGFNSNLMLNSHIEVDIKTWNDAISTPGRWNTFRAGPGKELCDKLDEMSALIDTIINDPKGSRTKLDKAIDEFAHKEQREFQEAQRKAREEAQERKKAQREAEQRRKKEELEAMLRQREESFIVALDVFIDAAPARTWHGKPIGLKTIQHYKHLRRYIRDFMKKKHITDIRFDELNKSFYSDYLSFAYGEGLKLNTIGDHIKVIKTVIRDQPMRIQCMAEDFLRCEKLKEESESIALLESEIELITKQELPTEHLRTVRNQFVLMCWTGARHSDLEQLNYNSIHVTEDGERYIQYKAKKTDKISVVKILPETQAILDLYDDGREMPRVISNQKFNDALKEIMKAVYEANPESTLAGYVTKAYTADVGNGRAGRKTDIYQRWQMVSCHTGRRSFATNMRLRGNDRDVICAATGHTTEASLSRYIKEDRHTRASRLK